MNNNSSQEFSSWLASSSWWLALILAGCLLIAALAIVLAGIKKKAPKKLIASKETYFEAFGGEENILDKELRGSRIVLKLKDASKVDQASVKKAGVDGFILMSNQLTLVIKGDAEEVYFALFGEKA